MDRNKFERKIKTAPRTVNCQTMNNILHKNYNNYIQKSDVLSAKTRFSIISIEELSELQKELTKELRNKGDGVGILEEMADVYICLQYLKHIYNYDDELFAQAVNVKLNRIYNISRGEDGGQQKD